MIITSDLLLDEYLSYHCIKTPSSELHSSSLALNETSLYCLLSVKQAFRYAGLIAKHSSPSCNHCRRYDDDDADDSCNTAGIKVKQSVTYSISARLTARATDHLQWCNGLDRRVQHHAEY